MMVRRQIFHTLSQYIMALWILVATLFVACSAHAEFSASELQLLAYEFFSWRASQQPSTHDDVNRVQRPDGWTPDWSPQALQHYDARWREFLDRLSKLDRTGWTVADSVDFLLLRSAILRVDHERNVVRSPQRDPDFYVQQTLGSVYELILEPPPFLEERARNLVIRLESIPATLQHARSNLIECVAPFASNTIATLAQIESQLATFSQELRLLLPEAIRPRFVDAVQKASDELVKYREWLRASLPRTTTTFAIGKQAYDRYLKRVALMPYTSDEILQMGRWEWERAVAFEQFEALRNKGLAQPPLFATVDEQIAQQTRNEERIRMFLVEKEILDVPKWMGRYRNVRMPAFLAPLRWLGVADDLTSIGRIGHDASKYILDPSPTLPFFALSMAIDPRPIIVHEGIPGHFFQLVLSGSNPRITRRYYIDSGPIEGIGFYAEEMMLQHGLFDDRPRTREIIYRFMRLRALRVEVDVKLARGEFTISDAARYLAQRVPMDEATAQEEAAWFAAGPGQAITYQIGKMQIIKLIADAQTTLGERFDLRALHNYVWRNGNVPIALLRWEYLGLRDEISTLF
ncbi:MAG: DUF885 domain-containing protein [Ignavibacteria bacterium]